MDDTIGKPQKNNKIAVDDLVWSRTLSKANLLGQLISLNTGCKKTIYIIKLTDTEYKMYIPDDVTLCNGGLSATGYNSKSLIPAGLNLKGKISVYGGKNVTSMESMFAETNFTSIDVSGVEAQNIENLHGMFYGCEDLETVKFWDFSTKAVSDTAAMFMYCQKLTDISLDWLSEAKIKTIRSMFYECRIEALNITGLNTNEILNMGLAFAYASIRRLTVREFGIKGARTAQGLFDSCLIGEVVFVGDDIGDIKILLDNCKIHNIKYKMQ